MQEQKETATEITNRAGPTTQAQRKTAKEILKETDPTTSS
jgi:hypothetical protein